MKTTKGVSDISNTGHNIRVSHHTRRCKKFVVVSSKLKYRQFSSLSRYGRCWVRKQQKNTPSSGRFLCPQRLCLHSKEDSSCCTLCPCACLADTKPMWLIYRGLNRCVRLCVCWPCCWCCLFCLHSLVCFVCLLICLVAVLRSVVGDNSRMVLVGFPSLCLYWQDR